MDARAQRKARQELVEARSAEREARGRNKKSASRLRRMRRKVGAALIETLAPWILRALARTWRVTKTGEAGRALMHSDERWICVMWHGRMLTLMPIRGHCRRGLSVLVSPSDDGGLANRALEKFGYAAVRGSLSKRGARAMREMHEALMAGKALTITPDGPRGPRHSINIGPAWLARATGAPAVFWLNRERAHDARLIEKVEAYLPDHETNGLTFEVLAPADACRYSLERIRRGEDTISVTGNVLRDYLTDLFPILEVGTSAKMLSIVPLRTGGGLFETGAGGSAPKHVQQFEKENHLRWDSLGEFMALAASFEHLAEQSSNASARILGEALDAATSRYLMENKAPSRKCGELDNRGTHYYLATFWARALADQGQDAGLAERFAGLAAALEGAEEQIVGELNGAQGQAMDIGGYYHPDPARASQAMRPSATLNGILEG